MDRLAGPKSMRAITQKTEENKVRFGETPKVRAGLA